MFSAQSPNVPAVFWRDRDCLHTCMSSCQAVRHFFLFFRCFFLDLLWPKYPKQYKKKTYLAKKQKGKKQDIRYRGWQGFTEHVGQISGSISTKNGGDIGRLTNLGRYAWTSLQHVLAGISLPYGAGSSTAETLNINHRIPFVLHNINHCISVVYLGMGFFFIGLISRLHIFSKVSTAWGMGLSSCQVRNEASKRKKLGAIYGPLSHRARVVRCIRRNLSFGISNKKNWSHAFHDKRCSIFGQNVSEWLGGGCVLYHAWP